MGVSEPSDVSEEDAFASGQQLLGRTPARELASTGTSSRNTTGLGCPPFETINTLTSTKDRSYMTADSKACMSAANYNCTQQVLNATGNWTNQADMYAAADSSDVLHSRFLVCYYGLASDCFCERQTQGAASTSGAVLCATSKVAECTYNNTINVCENAPVNYMLNTTGPATEVQLRLAKQMCYLDSGLTADGEAQCMCQLPEWRNFTSSWSDCCSWAYLNSVSWLKHDGKSSFERSCVCITNSPFVPPPAGKKTLTSGEIRRKWINVPQTSKKGPTATVYDGPAGSTATKGTAGTKMGGAAQMQLAGGATAGALLLLANC